MDVWCFHVHVDFFFPNIMDVRYFRVFKLLAHTCLLLYRAVFFYYYFAFDEMLYFSVAAVFVRFVRFIIGAR